MVESFDVYNTLQRFDISFLTIEDELIDQYVSIVYNIKQEVKDEDWDAGVFVENNLFQDQHSRKYR